MILEKLLKTMPCPVSSLVVLLTLYIARLIRLHNAMKDKKNIGVSKLLEKYKLKKNEKEN